LFWLFPARLKSRPDTNQLILNVVLSPVSKSRPGAPAALILLQQFSSLKAAAPSQSLNAELLKALRSQPLLKIRLLRSAQLDAAVNVLERMPQFYVGRGNFVIGEKALDVVAGLGSAESADIAEEVRTHVGGQLRVHLVPMRLDELPGLVAILRDLQRDGELNRGVLIAHLA
jgi:hypothetical protein